MGLTCCYDNRIEGKQIVFWQVYKASLENKKDAQVVNYPPQVHSYQPKPQPPARPARYQPALPLMRLCFVSLQPSCSELANHLPVCLYQRHTLSWLACSPVPEVSFAGEPTWLTRGLPLVSETSDDILAICLWHQGSRQEPLLSLCQGPCQSLISYWIGQGLVSPSSAVLFPPAQDPQCSPLLQHSSQETIHQRFELFSVLLAVFNTFIFLLS